MGFSGVKGVGTPQHLTTWARRRWGRGFRHLSTPRAPGCPVIATPLPTFLIFL